VTKLIFLQLNEINFDVVRHYRKRYRLPGFDVLMEQFEPFETFAEEKYEQLEPWIQWVSVYTGKTFAEHKVFRLGDVATVKPEQIFSILERQGLSVGAVSPMNAWNDLQNPAYFIPDPWTNTPSDSSGFSRRLTDMLRQTVNDNASGKISLKSLLILLECLVRTLSWRQTLKVIKLAAFSVRRPWMKALILDQMVHMIHLHLMRNRRADISFLFLNAGAHIQHHYFFNSEFIDSGLKNPRWYCDNHQDPIFDMIKMYDSVIQDYLALAKQGTGLLVATGLSQVPYDRVKFYYRLNSHESFLRRLGLSFTQVIPRMTRDFEVAFESRQLAEAALKILQSARMIKNELPIFGEIEDRGLKLFVTLTYPLEINSGDLGVVESGKAFDMSAATSFVAIKNGMHSGKGFGYISPNLIAMPIDRKQHVAALFGQTLQVFDKQNIGDTRI